MLLLAVQTSSEANITRRTIKKRVKEKKERTGGKNVSVEGRKRTEGETTERHERVDE